MLPLKNLFDAAEKEMAEVGLSQGTILCYRNVFHKLSKYSVDHNTEDYSTVFGNQFLEESLQSIDPQSRSIKDYLIRTIRYFNSYCQSGLFGFGTIVKRGWCRPKSEMFKIMIDEFQNGMKGLIEESTITQYTLYVSRMLCYFESIGITDPDDITVNLLPDFITETKVTVKDVTFPSIITALRRFTKYIGREDLSQFLNYTKPVHPKYIVPTLTPAEYNMLLDFLRTGDVSARNKAIVLLAVYTGMRSCDIALLRLSDVDWENDTFSFVQKKTGNPVKLPMLAEPWNAVYEYITGYRSKGDYEMIFLVDDFAPTRPLSVSAIKYIIRSVCSKAGISIGSRPGGTRLLRHSTASQLIRNDIPQTTIAAILGHADINTTSVYISTDEDRIRECCLPFLPSMRKAV